MGCGGSRLKNVNAESIPARFRPILRRRIEEVRRRRRIGSTKDHSTTEELLRVTAKEREEREEKVVRHVGGDEKEREDDEVTDLGDEDIDESHIIFPGSPSFRIYFVDNGEDEEEDEEDRNLETIKKEGDKEKIQSGDLDALPEKEHGMKPVVKKARKKRSLRVIPRGGQAAVKNLLNVKGCYTPTCVSRPDHAHLLSVKSQP